MLLLRRERLGLPAVVRGVVEILNHGHRRQPDGAEHGPGRRTGQHRGVGHLPLHGADGGGDDCRPVEACQGIE